MAFLAHFFENLAVFLLFGIFCLGKIFARGGQRGGNWPFRAREGVTVNKVLPEGDRLLDPPFPPPCRPMVPSQKKLLNYSCSQLCFSPCLFKVLFNSAQTNKEKVLFVKSYGKVLETSSSFLWADFRKCYWIYKGAFLQALLFSEARRIMLVYEYVLYFLRVRKMYTVDK